MQFSCIHSSASFQNGMNFMVEFLQYLVRYVVHIPMPRLLIRYKQPKHLCLLHNFYKTHACYPTSISKIYKLSTSRVAQAKEEEQPNGR